MTNLTIIQDIKKSSASPQWIETIINLKLLVFDFDGVFTDNSVYVREDGVEIVRCSRFDGFGISNLKAVGIKPFVLSTEKNPVVSARCRKLKLECEQACENKLESLEKMIARLNLKPGEVGFVGNDINDLTCLEYVGLPIVVADSHPSVLGINGLITVRKGGNGAVREICDFICKIRKTDERNG